MEQSEPPSENQREPDWTAGRGTDCRLRSSTGSSRVSRPPSARYRLR